MEGDQKKAFGIMFLLLVAVVAALGLYYWKLTAKGHVGPYGAIAMSDSALTYGGAWGYPDPISAYKRSVSECNKAGSTDCVVKVSLKDNCGALAISVQANRSFLVTGTDQVRTTQVALAQCQATGAGDCQVRENICSSAS